MAPMADTSWLCTHSPGQNWRVSKLERISQRVARAFCPRSPESFTPSPPSRRVRFAPRADIRPMPPFMLVHGMLGERWPSRLRSRPDTKVHLFHQKRSRAERTTDDETHERGAEQKAS